MVRHTGYFKCILLYHYRGSDKSDDKLKKTFGIVKENDGLKLIALSWRSSTFDQDVETTKKIIESITLMQSAA